MNCPPTSKCTEREFNTTKYIVSNCNVIEVTLTQKQNTDCTTEFVSLLDADGNSYPENSEFVSVNNQISRVVIEGLSACASDAMSGGGTIPTVQDCYGNNAVPVYDQCSITAINTADANNVSALNDVKTELQAINVNTDEVEGLLTEIRDRPVTDSWFLLYDSVDGGEFTFAIVDETMQSATLQSLASYHPSGQGVVFGPLLQSDDFGKATIQISGLVVGAPVYVYPVFYTYDPAVYQLFSYNIDSVGDITQPEGVQMSFTATAETETLTITMTGQVHDAVELYNVTAAYFSTGSCTPFIRRIVDDVVTDTEIDLTTPYTVTGEVRTSCSTGESGGGCDCSDELSQIKSVIDDINSKISTTSALPRSIDYSHKTSAYTVSSYYKSLSVSFENDGTVNGRYAPAGYSFTHDYFDGGYANDVMLDGTSYMVWEGR